LSGYDPELDPNYNPAFNPDDFNVITYPDNLPLEQALNIFRRAHASYQQQLKFRRKFAVDHGIVQSAWDSFLKLRKEHEHGKLG
jgi:hypothetical protein